MRDIQSKIIKTTLFLGLGLLGLGCGESKNNDAVIKIVDGVEIPATVDPSVVLLYNIQGEAGSICSGTFVEKNVVVTAAHCTEFLNNSRISGANEELEDEILVIQFDETIDNDDDPSNGISGGFFRVATSSRIFRNPNVTSRSIGRVTTNDIALLYFKDYESPDVSQISAVSPRRGDRARIVGFGADNTLRQPDDDSSTIKRRGNISISRVGDFINFNGPSTTTCRTNCGQRSNTGPGDSGGPMFVNEQLVGITSGGSRTSSSFVNVNSRSSRAFISSVEAELGISIR